MPEGIRSSIRLFAGDTVVYRQITGSADHTILQQDLHKLARWEAEYSMEFHPHKGNVLRVTRSRSPSIFNYILHATTLKSTESTTYLGVTLTKDLSWGKHVDNIRAKANQQLAFIRRNIRHSRSFNVRVLGAREVDGENCVNTVEQILLDKFAITGNVIENAHRTENDQLTASTLDT